MQTWRLIDTGFNDGCYNMAVDEAIAIAVREKRVPSTLRFYLWDPPCISVGYFQRRDKTREARMNRSGSRFRIDDPDDLAVLFHGNASKRIVRRITGGRAVFHGGDLSYSVVSGTDNSLFPGSINGTYSIIANALNIGLRNLGISSDTDKRKSGIKDSATKYQKTELCFNTAIRHEITFNGKKIIGSAQRRWSDAFLQHGSILVTGTMAENGQNSISLIEAAALSGVSLFTPVISSDDDNTPVSKNSKSACHKPVSGLMTDLTSHDIELLAASFSGGFTEVLGIRLISDELSVYEKALAEKLIAEKYSWL